MIRQPLLLRRLVLLLLVLAAPSAVHAQGMPGAAHVVVIGVDGLSPDGVVKARTPVLDALLARGAHTFKARAVLPSSSSPNWASMVMGAGPEQHGVLSNDWEPDHIELEPSCKGPTGRHPSIYGLVRAHRPQARIAVFHDWDGYGRLVEPGMADVVQDGDGPQATVHAATAYLKAEKPLFTFIHLDHVDHAGHEHGHGSAAYYASVEEADRLIGEVVDALRTAGLLEETVILVTADHGGKEKGHGGPSLGEMEIPWIVAGPGVRRGVTIEEPVDTFDTAATLAYVFGLEPPSCWIARPVRTAFEAAR